MMIKKGLPNCKFHDPWGWGFHPRGGHVSHYSEHALSSSLSIYSTVVAIVLRDYHAAFL